MKSNRLCALVLAVFLCFSLVACQSSEKTVSANTDSLMKPLVANTDWGMTLEEVLAELDEAGVAVVESNNPPRVYLQIAAEDAAKIGMQTVAGMELTEYNPQPISLHFIIDQDGVARFSYLSVMVHIPSEETRLPLTTAQKELTALLTKVYGEPLPKTTDCWGITGTKITKEQAENLTVAEREMLENDDYDCVNIYPRMKYAISSGGTTNLEATLIYNADSYVHLIYGNF